MSQIKQSRLLNVKTLGTFRICLFQNVVSKIVEDGRFVIAQLSTHTYTQQDNKYCCGEIYWIFGKARCNDFARLFCTAHLGFTAKTLRILMGRSNGVLADKSNRFVRL